MPFALEDFDSNFVSMLGEDMAALVWDTNPTKSGRSCNEFAEALIYRESRLDR